MITDQLNQCVLVITDDIDKWIAVGTYLSHKSDLFTFTGNEQHCRITGPFMDIRIRTEVGSMRSERYSFIVIERHLSPDEIGKVERAHMLGCRHDLQFEEWWIRPIRSKEPFEIKAPLHAKSDEVEQPESL